VREALPVRRSGSGGGRGSKGKDAARPPSVAEAVEPGTWPSRLRQQGAATWLRFISSMAELAQEERGVLSAARGSAVAVKSRQYPLRGRYFGEHRSAFGQMEIMKSVIDSPSDRCYWIQSGW